MAHFDFEALRRELRDAGISLWIEDDSTLVCWPSDKLTHHQIATLRANKPAILAAHRTRMIDLLPDAATCEAWRRRYCNANRERTT